MNIAIYLRKSRADSADESINDTLARHYDTLIKYARSHQLTVTDIYREVVSGAGLFTRPEMLRLLSAVEADKYGGILCMDIDRLGRSSQKDSGIIMETLKEHQCRIITPSRTYDLDDETDEMTTEMQTFIARQELKSITRRLRRGTNKAVEEGCHVSDIPYGYRRAYINRRSTLEPDPETAPIVRQIFEWYVNYGYGSWIIADKLNSAGFTARHGNPFSRNTVRYILRNPIYTGQIIFNRTHRIKKKKIGDKNKYVENPRDKWIIADNAHEPIVSRELFNKAEKIRSTRSHPPSFTGNLMNPLAGLIRCANCGGVMVRQTSKVGPRIYCPKTGCNGSCRYDIIEKFVFDTINQMLCEYRNTGEIKRRHTGAASRRSFLENALKNIDSEICTLNSQKNKLYDFLERGIYSEDVFLERSESIAERIELLRIQHEDYSDELSKSFTSMSDAEFVETAERLIDTYSSISPAAKNNIFKSFIKSVTFRKEPHSINEKTLEISIDFTEFE